MVKSIFGLCVGRHALPSVVTGYIFSGSIVDPTKVIEMQRIAANVLEESNTTELVLYVTGLTPALIATLNAAKAVGVTSVTLMHFDRETGEYFPQPVEF